MPVRYGLGEKLHSIQSEIAEIFNLKTFSLLGQKSNIGPDMFLTDFNISHLFKSVK